MNLIGNLWKIISNHCLMQIEFKNKHSIIMIECLFVLIYLLFISLKLGIIIAGMPFRQK